MYKEFIIPSSSAHLNSEMTKDELIKLESKAKEMSGFYLSEKSINALSKGQRIQLAKIVIETHKINS